MTVINRDPIPVAGQALRIKLIALLTGAALLLALGVVLTFRSFQQIEASSDARKRTSQVINSADDLLSELKDAETAQRGYLLTGNEVFLQPYLAVRVGMSDRLQQLRRRVQIASAIQHLDELVPLLNAKLAELAQAIELRRNHQDAAALALVSSGQGKRLMDSIRLEMHHFAQIEEAALAQREAEFESDMRRLFGLMVAASLFMLLAVLAFAVLISRQTKQRIRHRVYLETQHLLETQATLNQQLQQANTTLQVSEEMLAVTINSIGDAVIATDDMARVTRLNPLAEQLTGWTQAQAQGRPIADIFQIVNKDSRQPVVIPVIDALAHGTVQGLANHTVLLARDGHEYDIADSCAPILDRDRQVIGAVLVFRDVTEEYATQQSARDAATLVHAILNTVADGIITLHAQGGIVETVNPAIEKMFGYGTSELIGKNFSQLIPEFDWAQCISGRSLDSDTTSQEPKGAVLGREVVGRRRDGSVFTLEIALSEMWLGGERHLTGILRDFTARKQIEEERQKLDQRLRDQQFYTRSLIEANIDAIMTTNPSGIITDVNKQMESLTDCTRDELIGAPFKKYFTDPERAEAAINLALTQKRVTNYELTARTRGGLETVVSYNATTFYDRDRTLQGVFAAARDVTERKRMDRVLEEKNDELEGARALAEKANRAKSEFLSSMSHELRSPLNAILGFAQLMETESPAPSVNQQECIAQILRAGWHLLKLINEILDLTKIESGRIPLSKEPVLLADIMQDCQSMFEHQAQQRGIQLIIPSAASPVYVLADRTRLKQVFINLLNNAIKYNTLQGTVEVTCAPGSPGCLRVNIRDTGMGLTPEQLTQLFQAFNRLGQEATSVEGTGIGLVVARQLVELMGGTIGVESQVGVGSVFWFELIHIEAPDDALAAIEETQRLPEESAHTQVRTLLYVEDNPANMRLVEKLIERHPRFKLLTATNGRSGFELARAKLPDVILLDINLPGINGFETLKLLQSDPATAHIPALAISANAMPSDFKKGQEAGFFRYLTKPIMVDELMGALSTALEFSERNTP